MNTSTDLELLPNLPAVPGAADPLDAMPRADAVAIFEPLRERLIDLKRTAESIKVTDRTQVSLMKIARATRLEFKGLRLLADDRHKDLTEDMTKRKRAIDADRAEIRDLCKQYEAKLLADEEFADREIEAERRDMLIWRTEQVQPYVEPLALEVAVMNLDYLSPDQFTALMEQLATDLREKREREAAALQAAEEAEQLRKAEELRLREENDRLEREAAAARKERDRLAAEQKIKDDALKAEADRLAKEARKRQEAIEAQAKRDKAAADAVAEQARAQAKALQDQIDAEAQRQRDAEAARVETARKLACAGDAELLRHFAAQLEAITPPVLNDLDLTAKIHGDHANRITRLRELAEVK